MNKFESNNKRIQQQRIVNIFIDSTVELIGEKGIDNVTLRNVANLAGYNSATIYNYFENLDHLKFFAAMTYLDEYIVDLKRCILNSTSPIDYYKNIWRCFVYHAFKKPDIYSSIFFADLEKDLGEYVAEFYDLYPLNVEGYPEVVVKMLTSNSIKNRSSVLMDECIEKNLFTKEDGQMVDELIIFTFESLLSKVRSKKMTADNGREVFNNYLNRLIGRLKIEVLS